MPMKLSVVSFLPQGYCWNKFVAPWKEPRPFLTGFKTFCLLDETPFKWTTEPKTVREWVLALSWGVLDIKPASGGTLSEEHKCTAWSHPSCSCWEEAEERGKGAQAATTFQKPVETLVVPTALCCEIVFAFFSSWILMEKRKVSFSTPTQPAERVRTH